MELLHSQFLPLFFWCYSLTHSLHLSLSLFLSPLSLSLLISNNVRSLGSYWIIIAILLLQRPTRHLPPSSTSSSSSSLLLLLCFMTPSPSQDKGSWKFVASPAVNSHGHDRPTLHADTFETQRSPEGHKKVCSSERLRTSLPPHTHTHKLFLQICLHFLYCSAILV